MLAQDSRLWRAETHSAQVFEDTCAAHAPTTHDWTYGDAAIGFVLAGCFEYATQHGGAFVAPGTIVLGNAGERFGVRHVDTLGNRRLVVSLPSDVLRNVAEEYDTDAHFASAALTPGPDALRLFALMRSYAASPSEDLLYPIAALALCSPDARATTPVSAEDKRRVRDVVGYIDAHYGEACTLATLAERAALSRYHFLRTFASVVGLTPTRYVINTRLRAAAERLIATREPITEIALDVGFNDISHFYACFRTAFGCTPKQWRERRAISPKTTTPN